MWFLCTSKQRHECAFHIVEGTLTSSLFLDKFLVSAESGPCKCELNDARKKDTLRSAHHSEFGGYSPDFNQHWSESALPWALPFNKH
jgi:hypothetical protein